MANEHTLMAGTMETCGREYTLCCTMILQLLKFQNFIFRKCSYIDSITCTSNNGIRILSAKYINFGRLVRNTIINCYK